MNDLISGKNILVTGGTGSIGSEIVRQVLNRQPGELRILSRDPLKQQQLYRRLGKDRRLRWLIGDVRDPQRVHEAVRGCAVVFHAAALKHVPLCEDNPLEAVRTNILGTANIIRAAADTDCRRVIFISTDKAAEPTNAMGATKMLAEKLMASALDNRQPGRPVFASVRFGNVLGSRGSVVPRFIEQMLTKRELKLTDPGMTRFFMTIPQAVRLVLSAAEEARGGETFVLKMPVLRIQDLALAVAEETCRRTGLKRSDIRTRVVGRRPGEKMYEELMTEEEATDAVEQADLGMYVIRPKGRQPGQCLVKPPTSDALTPLPPEQIRNLIAPLVAAHPLVRQSRRQLKKEG